MRKAESIVSRIAGAGEIASLDPEVTEPYLKKIVKNEPVIQLLAMTDLAGKRISQVHTQRGDKALYRNLLNKDFNDRDWFAHVIETRTTFVSDLFFSKFHRRVGTDHRHADQERRRPRWWP